MMTYQTNQQFKTVKARAMNRTLRQQRLVQSHRALVKACQAVLRAFETLTPYEIEANGYDGAEAALEQVESALSQAKEVQS